MGLGLSERRGAVGRYAAFGKQLGFNLMVMRLLLHLAA